MYGKPAAASPGIGVIPKAVSGDVVTPQCDGRDAADHRRRWIMRLLLAGRFSEFRHRRTGSVFST
jgi:hypothetical protein